MTSQTLHAGARGTTPLAIDHVADTEAGIPWTDMARAAATSRATSMASLLDVLVVVGAAAALAGFVTVVALGWSRASARRGEVSVQRAVGASRRVLVASALVEGLAMVAPALLLGVVTGWVAVRTSLGRWPEGLHPWALQAWLPALAATLTLAGVSLLILRHARGQRLAGLPPGTMGLVPVVVQMAACLAILAGAATVSRQATHVAARGDAVPDGVRFEVDARALPAGARAGAYADLLASARERPSVDAAAVTSPGMAVGLGQVDWIQTDCGQCPSATIILRWHDVEATHHVISPDTFRVLNLPLLDGRGFTAADSAGAPRVAIVNRQLALRHFQDGKPIGRTMRIGAVLSRASYVVVGVVDDTRPPVLGSGAAPREALYLSALQHPPVVADLLVRGAMTGALPAGPGVTLTARPGLRATQVHEASVLGWFARVVRLEGLLALVATVLGAFVAMRAWSRGQQGELALHRAVGAPGWRVILSVAAHALAAVGIAALAAHLFLAPSLQWLVAIVVRDPDAARVSWAPAALLAVAALAGALGPAVRTLRLPVAQALD